MLCTSIRGILRDQDQRPHVAVTLQLLYNDKECHGALYCNISFTAFCQRAVSVQLYNMYSIVQCVRTNSK